jgi:hypothetical protein
MNEREEKRGEGEERKRRVRKETKRWRKTVISTVISPARSVKFSLQARSAVDPRATLFQD